MIHILAGTAVGLLTGQGSLGLRVALATDKSVKGWDLFGRVPNDDWLFKTSSLLDPNLLKRSMVEAVSHLSYVIHTFSVL